MKHTDTDKRQVAFFGRMTAGITHEMKNVLAIIKESSGLMQDCANTIQKTTGNKVTRICIAA